MDVESERWSAGMVTGVRDDRDSLLTAEIIFQLPQSIYDQRAQANKTLIKERSRVQRFCLSISCCTLEGPRKNYLKESVVIVICRRAPLSGVWILMWAEVALRPDNWLRGAITTRHLTSGASGVWSLTTDITGIISSTGWPITARYSDHWPIRAKSQPPFLRSRNFLKLDFGVETITADSHQDDLSIKVALANRKT